MSRPFVELYIGNQKVEFKEPPQINITYAHTDLHNPSVVKNSFSKTITIDGTPNNNKIFNSIYDLKRVNGDGLYNPSKKVDFTLYRNGEPMETGYVKLDKVKRKGNNVQYDITLYGGLGQFLYNLQYREDGEKMRLSDLDYGYDMNLELNKETIKSAWQHITEMKSDTSTEVYDHINFAPCYNGIPKDFSADKVAINVSSFSSDEDLYNSFLQSKDGYGLVDGWLIGELKKEYDEWQTKDLRSYLQRPVIRFKDVIEACCKPENNGGYTVELDTDFFNKSNPYYEDAWMTLPLFSEIERGVDSEITVVNDNMKFYVEGGNKGDIVKIKMKITPAITSDADTSTIKTGKIWYKELEGSGDMTGYPFYNEYKQNMGRCIQLVVKDKYGEIIGGSARQAFCTNIPDCNTFNFSYAYAAPITYNYGTYQHTEDNIFAFEKGVYEFETTVDYQEGMYFEIYQSYSTIPAYGDDTYRGMMFDNKGNGVSDFQYGYGTHTAEAKMILKKRIIDKKKILNSENTPCDYFLSYLKMFNLHIWKDMYDKKIYVRLRKNFFNDSIYGLDEYVDRGDNMTITPLTFENKWLVMENKGVENNLFKDYVDEFGIDYGIQKIDTNYNFDSSSKNIFEKSVFKSTIQQRGRSKYYVNLRYTDAKSEYDIPSYYLDGFNTYLFNGAGDTTEGSTITPKTADEIRLWWKEKYYDFMPKPNFTDSKNEPIDGANVLLFYNGKQLMRDKNGVVFDFKITDDIPQFEQLNDGKPCWIWTYNWQLATDTTIGGSPFYGNGYLPNFSRYKINENGWITHSWDFGTPKYLYIPDYSIDETSDIYSQYWKPYIRDMYDANTRVVECQVLLKERVIGDWLQRFYYFDGSYWVLNKVIDYDVTSNGTTKCEFVRVNDIQNYL